MNFEEMKIIWDSQNREPLYAINAAALHDLVRHRRDEEHRRTACRHGLESLVNALCGVAMLFVGGLLTWGDPDWLATSRWVRVPIAPWHAVAFCLAGTAWLFCAAYMWIARRRQLRREEPFALSMQGDLERAIAHVGFQIQVARSILWWGLIPAWLAAGLCVAALFHLSNVSAWSYALIVMLMMVSFVGITWWQSHAIRHLYEPRRRELESLRAKLADPNA